MSIHQLFRPTQGVRSAWEWIKMAICVIYTDVPGGSFTDWLALDFYIQNGQPAIAFNAEK